MKNRYLTLLCTVCMAATVTCSAIPMCSFADTTAQETAAITDEPVKVAGPGAGSASAASSSNSSNSSNSGAGSSGTASAATGSAASSNTATGSTATGSTSAADTASASASKNGYANGEQIGLNSAWKYADFSAIHTGAAVMYTATGNRKNKIVAVNAGHGTKGGSSVKTYCHPDKTAKITGGSTAAGAYKATAVSSGMTFKDGTADAVVTLKMAQILKEKLLANGYDVLMIRDGEDVQLDNIARTVISNNVADIHIALHWDGDSLNTTKGVFYMSVPDGLKSMEPVASHWQEHERLGDNLISGLKAQGIKVWSSNPLDTDLTQTSYSTIPSVDIELGNQCSDHSDSVLNTEAEGLTAGINSYFGF